MSIDVKETDDGDFFYSFHAEQGIKKESAQQTLHAAVAKDNLDNTFNKIVPRMKEEVNTDTGDSRLFQERDFSELSDRELLANAVESVAQNDTERDYIKRYKKHIAELNEKQLAMQEAEEQIRELKAEDAKGNRDEIIKLQNKVDIYAKQISRYENTGRFLRDLPVFLYSPKKQSAPEACYDFGGGLFSSRHIIAPQSFPPYYCFRRHRSRWQPAR